MHFDRTIDGVLRPGRGRRVNGLRSANPAIWRVEAVERPVYVWVEECQIRDTKNEAVDRHVCVVV